MLASIPRWTWALLLSLLLAGNAQAESQVLAESADETDTVPLGLVIAAQGNDALRRIREEARLLPLPSLPEPAAAPFAGGVLVEPNMGSAPFSGLGVAG